MAFWEAKATAGSTDLRPWGNGALRPKQLQELESMQDSSEPKCQQCVQRAGAHREPEVVMEVGIHTRRWDVTQAGWKPEGVGEERGCHRGGSIFHGE